MENPTYDHMFAAITLHRPMQLFKTCLVPSTSIGVPVVPNGDFLVRLVTDYRSHTALLRTTADSEFKNLENLLRGRHQLSETTLSNLSRQFHLPPEELRSWVHKNKKGPLAPNLFAIFFLLEAVPGAFASQMLTHPVFCQCCGRNMLDDRDVFWSRQPVTYATPEYEFAERLLRAVVGAAGIASLIAKIAGKSYSWRHVAMLAHPSKYPIRHWLTLVQPHYQTASLKELSGKMELMSANACRVPYTRLKKWSSGQDLMPVAVANALSSSASEPMRLWVSFMLARVICFIVDYLCSAAIVKPERLEVQQIVHCRIIGLLANMQMGIRETQKHPQAN